jgi:hypothetical protein
MPQEASEVFFWTIVRGGLLIHEKRTCIASFLPVIHVGGDPEYAAECKWKYSGVDSKLHQETNMARLSQAVCYLHY